MFSSISLKALIMFFLVRSISGPDLFLRTASPSSRYKPRSLVGMIFDSLFKINRPTSSHISAPSKDPIVTSNSESLLIVQIVKRLLIVVVFPLIVVVFPLYLFLRPLISSIAISSLSVHASLLPSFAMFFLSHYLPRICNLIASQFFAASDT